MITYDIDNSDMLNINILTFELVMLTNDINMNNECVNIYYKLR